MSLIGKIRVPLLSPSLRLRRRCLQLLELTGCCGQRRVRGSLPRRDLLKGGPYYRGVGFGALSALDEIG